MLSIAEPLNELWHIVYSFHINYDKWYYGKLNCVEFIPGNLEFNFIVNIT